MYQNVKRITALCLLAALIVGLVSGVPFINASAASIISADADTEATNLLSNPSFESAKSNGKPVDWTNWGNAPFTTVTGSDKVFAGSKALQITASAATDTESAKVGGVQSANIPVEAGITYYLSGYAKETYIGGSGYQMYIKFYDADGKELSAGYTSTSAIGKWGFYEVRLAAPEGVSFARVLLVSGAGKGTIYFDDLCLVAEGKAEWAPELVDIAWEQIYSDYPRLDTDKTGLEDIIAFTQFTDVSAYGYSGAGALEKLITAADKYVAETEMSLTYLETTTIVFPLSPVLEDPTCREEFNTAPGNFSPTYRYPYMTSFGSSMVTRMQTLALAYAVTGNEAYGARAKQYALDMCTWQYWAGYRETIEVGDELSSQASGYILDCVMLAYDLCHDLFTDAELATMEAQIMEKGLEAMYHDCWPRMIKNRDMDHATGLILASCLIMDEDNIDELKKYLDMGVTYINWRLDFLLKSGINEGHMYDSLAIDDIVVTMQTLKRVTGYEGPFDHPYMEQVEKRFLGFFEMVNGTLPAYSDSQFKSTYYPYSAALLSRQGNELATYYLAVGGALSTAYDQLIWHTDMSLSDVKVPDDRVGNVTNLEAHGQGALRTGWGTLDSLLVINANNSQQEHNHFDQNSILLAFNRNWILNDSEYKDNAYTTLTTWELKYTNSTIFVDGEPQVRKGQGSLEQVFNSHVYGYMIGSAPAAYGLDENGAVLNKFDRHVIMLNHDSMPYYIVIDDLDSNSEHSFGWNFYGNGKLALDDELYTNYWDQVEMDGQVVANGTSATGNRLTLFNQGCTLHSYFVGAAVTTKEVSYLTHGPTLMVENSTPAKNYQFMNILSVEKDTATQYTTKFADLIGNPDKISLKYTDNNYFKKCTVAGEEMVQYVLNAGTTYNGPGLNFKFDVPEDGEYFITVDLGQTMTTENYWNVYITGIDNNNDGKTDCLSAANAPKGPEGVFIVDCGKQYLTAGEHEVYIILSGSAVEGASIAMGGINLRKVGATMGEGTVKVTESYDEGDLLGATISYGTTLKDIVLFNRGTGTIAGGGLSTNGQQASILGLNGTDISEGYAVTNATSLKYGDLVLITSAGPVSLAIDYTMAKAPVKNGANDPVADKDFNELDPVVYISSKADAATAASIYLGLDTQFNAYVDGVAVASTYENGILTMTVPAGEHQITVTGAHFHNWTDATCDTPKTCALCGVTEGEALGHNWVDADCTSSKHCTICNQSTGGPVHVGVEGQSCVLCGKTFGYCNENVTWTLENGVLTLSGVGAMADYASGKAPWYASRASITSVVVEDGVTTIGNYAFYNCTNLTSVTMGDDVTSIGNSAFRGCTGLNAIALGAGVTALVDRAFYGCTNLAEIALPAGLANVGNYTFYNCKALANVYFCGSEEQWAEVTVGNQNTYLQNATLAYHDWIEADCYDPETCAYCGLTRGDVEHVWIDATCTAPKTCFICGTTEGTPQHNVVDEICTVCQRYGTCGDNLTWTLSEDGTLTISGTGAMADYTGGTGANPAPWYSIRNSIKKVIIEDGVTTIGKYAFVLCEKLTSVEMGDDVTLVGYASFHQCRALEGIVFGESVTTIAQQSFAACPALEWIGLPISIELIDAGAFYKCNALATTYYCGTDDQWAEVVINTGATGTTSSNEWLLDNTRQQHNWTEGTCTDPRVCLICGITTDGTVAGHTWVEATCTTPKTCSVCGITEGSALGHSWTAATCTAPKTCAACGATEGEALDHSYSFEETKAPTCTEIGLLTFTCDRCDDSYTETVDALGHSYSETVVDVTCTEAGYTKYTCDKCGDSYTTDEFPATGHSFNQYVSDNNATFTADGTKTAKCDNCDATDTIPDVGSMLVAVAKIGEEMYASLEDALAAAKAGDTVTLLKDATVTADTTLAAGVTYEIPADVTLTVAEGASVTADPAATLNCAGLIKVAGNADISDLVYGSTFGAKGGKLTIAATGTVTILDQWIGVWTPINDAQLGAMLQNCETGAKAVVGEDTWTLTDSGWTHELHTYVDGTCTACGKVSVLTDSKLVFVGAPGLSFQDYIGMQIMLRNKTVSGYESFYVEITQVDFEGNVTTTQTTGAPYGSFTFFEQQILSWSMTEEVTMTLYAVKDGVTYKGQSFTTSVEALALEKIPSYVSSGDMARAKALVDMLNFGSAVQTAYSHNTTDLPNADLGDLAQYGTTGDPEFTAVNDITGTNAIKVYSNNISMQSKVEFQFMVKTTALEGKTVVAKMGDADATVTYEAMGTFTIIRVACGAAYMRDTFTIVVNDAEGNAVTCTYNVTVEGYASQQLSGEKAPAMLALIRYGDAVAAIG